MPADGLCVLACECPPSCPTRDRSTPTLSRSHTNVSTDPAARTGMCSTVSGAGPPSTEQECESEPVFSHPNVAPVAAPAPPPMLLRQQSDSNSFTVSGFVTLPRSTPLIPLDAHWELPPM